jgi:hypothetical protein
MKSNTMQLAIYEPEHFETAYALIRLFDLPAHSITVFANRTTSERLHEMFGARAAAYHWIIQQKDETNRQFIRKMYASLKTLKPDIFILGTVSHNYLLHAFLTRTSRVKRILLTVHEVNSLFRPQLRLGIKKTGNYLGKKLLTRRINEYVSILETLVPQISDCLPHHKKIYLLSGAVFENDQASVPIRQPVRIVVPGTIEQSRRDYTHVVDLLNAAEAAGLQLEITLLGMVREKMQQPNIITYNDIVPQPEFDAKMREAHFIFAPTVPGTISPDGTPEIYGVTKASGNIFDMIRYARPAFVPDHLTMPANLESACIRYHFPHEIAAYIKKMIEEPSHYETLQQNALEGSRNYTVEKIRAANPELFN